MTRLDDWPCLMSLYSGDDQEQLLAAAVIGSWKNELLRRRLESPEYDEHASLLTLP